MFFSKSQQRNGLEIWHGGRGDGILIELHDGVLVIERAGNRPDADARIPPAIVAPSDPQAEKLS